MRGKYLYGHTLGILSLLNRPLCTHFEGSKQKVYISGNFEFRERKIGVILYFRSY